MLALIVFSNNETKFQAIQNVLFNYVLYIRNDGMNTENNMASSYSIVTVFLEVQRDKRIDGIYEWKKGDLVLMF